MYSQASGAGFQYEATMYRSLSGYKSATKQYAKYERELTKSESRQTAICLRELIRQAVNPDLSKWHIEVQSF